MSTGNEAIFTGGEPFEVVIEFESSISLRTAEALFSAIRSKDVEYDGEMSLHFNVMYAGELANVLIALDETFVDSDYMLRLRWNNGRSGIYVQVLVF